ncbi:hypothetical protein QOZ80_3BG0273090 [Eleusine coracana subsp. coracana]|nr:hypothetical protein QOZ80_3BG0273090 [Eleusine coracana subsp. coracana]
MCDVCMKPLRLCLCGRLRSPPVDTAVGVTVLQHAMEAHHPLNSTRVARLGLRNLAVAQVTDVNHCARFVLTTLGADGGATASDLRGGIAGPVAGAASIGNDGELASSPDEICVRSDRKICAAYSLEKTEPNACGYLGMEVASLGGSNEKLDIGDVHDDVLVAEIDSLGSGYNSDVSFGLKKYDGQPPDFVWPRSAKNQTENSYVDAVNGGRYHGSEMGLTYNANGNLASVLENGFETNGTILHSNGVGNKKEDIASLGQHWTREKMDKCTIAYTEKELSMDIERGVKPKIRWLSRGPLGQAAVSNGFVVTKIQTKKSKLTGELTEFEEFSITIPRKSALLFPCQRAISIDASGCQVQHLIVLDGTWAKAQRMYHENPWLQLLPHVKLESETVSLYSEVRHEPRAGCLSTVESIVVAMRKLGEDSKGLDDLLDVFESMIADQRRCKDENCKQKQESQS